MKKKIHKKNICQTCHKEFDVTYHQRHKLNCSKKCFSIYARNKKINMSFDAISNANKKRRETNLKKYNRKASLSSQQQSRIVKKTYDKTKNILENIIELYDISNTANLLNSKKYHFSKYIGKSKNRTMINDTPKLYKSLLHHTKFIEEQKLYGEKRTPLSLRLLIAGKHKFNITEDMYCRCQSRISFDHLKLDFSKLYCEKCILPRNSKEHFKYKYGDNWKKSYKLNCEKMSHQNYINMMNYFKKIGMVACPNIGKNEKQLLDEQEIKDKCIIDRNFRIGGYYPDGYCHETNTIYEKYHKLQMKKDLTRINNLRRLLNCDVKIIYDGWDPNE
jgi:hypothetical protein